MISGRIDFALAVPDPSLKAAGGLLEGKGIGMAAAGPNAELFSDGTIVVAAAGRPRFADERGRSQAAAWAELYRARGIDAPSGVRGSFSVAIVDLASRCALLAVDRFAIEPLCYAASPSGLSFATRADQVRVEGARGLDLQAIFNYLYFHVIPAPRTVFQGVERMRSGHAMVFDGGRAREVRYWQPRFEANPREPLEDLKQEFRHIVRAAVARDVSGATVGCFLSGGTDSSTVTGMVGEATGQPPRTYSIGFDAEGYDEMAYARIAARHFKADHHEKYLTPGGLVDAIPKVAAHYDQPFGNSSAVPAFVCASMAREDGVTRLLAGDGGDELFGGNTRYAKQRVFEAYSTLPAAVRRGLLEPVLLGVPGIEALPVIRKAASYVRQARAPMPDRLNSYNLLMRLGVGAVLTPEFLARVDPMEPEVSQRETYAASNSRSLVNRMLAYDWVHTLADSDLPKVRGATGLAGLDVAFPLLADELVDFSLKLPPEMKVKGLELRWFFKEALRGFLPDATIAKKKHGFGLPFGPWLVADGGLADLARDAFAGLRARGVVRAEFLDELLGAKIREHPAFYGEMVWILVMLELWLRQHAPRSTIF